MPLDNLQRYYWTRFRQASYHFIAEETALGLDICVGLFVTPASTSC